MGGPGGHGHANGCAAGDVQGDGVVAAVVGHGGAHCVGHRRLGIDGDGHRGGRRSACRIGGGVGEAVAARIVGGGGVSDAGAAGGGGAMGGPGGHGHANGCAAGDVQGDGVVAAVVGHRGAHCIGHRRGRIDRQGIGLASGVLGAAAAVRGGDGEGKVALLRRSAREHAPGAQGQSRRQAAGSDAIGVGRGATAGAEGLAVGTAPGDSRQGPGRGRQGQGRRTDGQGNGTAGAAVGTGAGTAVRPLHGEGKGTARRRCARDDPAGTQGQPGRQGSGLDDVAAVRGRAAAAADALAVGAADGTSRQGGGREADGGCCHRHRIGLAAGGAGRVGGRHRETE